MLTFFRSWRSRIAYLFETAAADAGTAGAAGAAAATGGGDGKTAATGDGGSGSTASTGTNTAAGKTEPAFTYKEDRSRWVPGHRIVEETTARTAAERKAAEAIARADAAEKRVRALAGVDPNAASEAEAEKVKSNFFALFPQFAKLTPEVLDKVLAAVERGDSADAAIRHTWDRLAQTTLRNLENRFLEVIGADKLNDRQRAKLHGSWGAMMKADPENFRLRYEAEDPQLIEDFIKEFTEDFVDPVRRLHAAGVVPRPPVPRGGPGHQVTTVPPKINYLNPEEVENYAVARMKEAGYLTER